MNKEFDLRCYHNNDIKPVKLKISKDEDDVAIYLEMEELCLKKHSSDYFSALIEIRKELEPMNIKLLCKGCCRNVYPSPMSFDMCGGIVAYSMTMGRESERDDMVNIFTDCDIDDYATIEEQQLFLKQWYAEIKRIRDNIEQ